LALRRLHIPQSADFVNEEMRVQQFWAAAPGAAERTVDVLPCSAELLSGKCDLAHTNFLPSTYDISLMQSPSTNGCPVLKLNQEH
jgi:hypothetical protein